MEKMGLALVALHTSEIKQAAQLRGPWDPTPPPDWPKLADRVGQTQQEECP